jgi:ribosomal protein S18 acetylase RimI-like enzyme
MYLSCEAARFPIQPPKIGVLRFEPYDESQRERLVRLIERTYEGTLDCPALGSGRHIDDVVSGYRATGQYRPENWQFVCAQSAGDLKGLDVGVLLLADHPGPRHWELIYMGLTPEARGRGWGKTIALQAQWQAQRAGALRLVLAVDAANLPALAAYRATHFLAWDQRAVFVRFPATDRAAN